MYGKKLILASISPRRENLLRMIGFDFEVVNSQVDEQSEVYTIPEVHVLELAQKKALKVAEKIDGGLIIGADTVVVLNNQILGKPKDAKQAKEILQQLSGKTHEVYTGFAIVEKPSGEMLSEFVKTLVSFRKLADEEIDRYIQSGSPFDKAGGYGIQDQGALFVQKIDGCFYNVMGLPVTKLYQALEKFVRD
ncbi:MAG: septum formation inhibitor Maf [Caldithrix sp.]|nr:MAG: septum formation inhibitor Maf [Caldithrix sp.]